jgi:hypothetical protein
VASEIPDPVFARQADSVVLVTLDGVRRQEVFDGVDAELAARAGMPRDAVIGAGDLLPNIHRLFFDGGVVLGSPAAGPGIVAGGPRYVSLPGYLELMTGAPAICWSNDCQPVVGWTLAEELGDVARPEQAAVFASWDRIHDVFPQAPGVMVRAGRGLGDDSDPHPGHGAYQPDRVTIARALEHLDTHRPRFLWIALGDTDEWAHRGDYPGYLDALRTADRFIAELATRIARAQNWGERAALVITTDHGRDPAFADHGVSPEAAQVWLMARGAGVSARGTVATEERRHLRDVAPTVLTLLGRPVEACGDCGTVIDEVVAVANDG